jgi:hypothetical protein
MYWYRLQIKWDYKQITFNISTEIYRRDVTLVDKIILLERNEKLTA